MDTRASARLRPPPAPSSRIADPLRALWQEKRKSAPEKSERSAPMELRSRLYVSVAAIGVVVLLTAPPAQLRAQQSAPPGVSVGDSDLGGVVRGANGPEAGVWVIAETTDLPTKFAKM